MMKKMLLLSLACIGLATLKAQPITQSPKQCLWIDIAQISRPVFDTLINVDGRHFDDRALINFPYITLDQQRPSLKRPWGTAHWKEINMDSTLRLSPSTQGSMQLSVAALYVRADQYLKTSVKIVSHAPFELYVDDQKIGDKSSSEPDSLKAGSLSRPLVLEPGYHKLLVKILRMPHNKEAHFQWFFESDSTVADQLTFSTDATQWMDIDHIVHGPQVSNPRLSYDGRYYALTFSETSAPEGKRKSHTEIRNAQTHQIETILRGVYNVQFAPHANQLTYVTGTGAHAELMLFDIDKKTEQTLLSDIDQCSGFRFTPNGQSLLFYQTIKAPVNTTGLNKLEGMHDRWPGFRNRQRILRYDIANGVRQALTNGYLSTYIHDISADGQELLFSTSDYNFTQRPFTKQTLYRIGIDGSGLETIWESNFGGSAQFTMDPQTLLVQGSAEMFDGVGANVQRGQTVNTYDVQLFLYHTDTRKAEAITKSFNPSVKTATLTQDGRTIYLSADDRDGVSLYRYTIADKQFEKLPIEAEVLGDYDMSRDGSQVLYTAQGIARPTAAFKIDTKTLQNTNIANPRDAFYQDVVFGKADSWTFKNKNGTEIDGVFYLPPNFDSTQKYPMIVYYYAGTSATPRALEMRYNKQLFAAMGYVVYVLQPSGATGYGQAFSAAHVNNWGVSVADEIIKGVKEFCAQHPYVDAKRIGCIGASYGGFMTQYLQTRTQIFAAAISHAGISALSSYWGEGFWGYLYSSAASANSYPWNNPKLYVDQSPLFHADKIQTPLLLIHGTSDVNVPVGESYQMYTALKLLGKNVELVQVEGEDHGIVNYEKRILWEKTILAWFDKYLKNNSLWWSELYPEKKF